MEALSESEFAAIARTSPLQACLKISKLFVANQKGLVAVAPSRYQRGTTDPRAAGYTEEVATEAFKSLNTVKK